MHLGSTECDRTAASASRCVHPHAMPSTATRLHFRPHARLKPTARLTACHMSCAGGLSGAGKLGLGTAYTGEAAAIRLEDRGRVESAGPRFGVCGLRPAAGCMRARSEPTCARMCTRMIAQPAAPSQGMQGRTRAACRTLKTLFMCVWARICRIWRTVVPASRATRLQ